MPPPLLYDLTELQRHANRLFGFSAQKTLDLAQALYEKHKLISYPRTDSRHLSQDVARTLPRWWRRSRRPIARTAGAGHGRAAAGPRFVDDAKVTDHHAIIPTATPPERASCRRTSGRSTTWSAGACSPPGTTTTSGRSRPSSPRSGTAAIVGPLPHLRHGRAADGVEGARHRRSKSKKKGKEGDEAEEQALPPGLAKGQPQDGGGRRGR